MESVRLAKRLCQSHSLRSTWRQSPRRGTRQAAATGCAGLVGLESGEDAERGCRRTGSRVLLCRIDRPIFGNCNPQNGSFVVPAAQQLLLLPLALLLIQLTFHSDAGPSLGVLGGQVVPTPPKRYSFLDEKCFRWRHNEPSEVEQLLMELKCDIKPLYEQYVKLALAYGQTINTVLEGESSSLDSGIGISRFLGSPMSEARVGGELSKLSESIDTFADEGLAVLGLKDFCTYPTITRLSNLRSMIGNSTLLALTYDLIAIEFHKSCLTETITQLPPIPYLVRDVVKIYIDGADKSLPDLNGEAPAEGNDEDDEPFDVVRAIEKNGQLEDVMGLLLTIPLEAGDSSGERAEAFKRTCKDFLITIEQRWQSMEMMNSMLATDGNGIHRLNNYIMRKLMPTKYADICSQLSTRT